MVNIFIHKYRKVYIRIIWIAGKFSDPEPCYDDLLIYELAEWFKSSFFTWVNTLPCKVCKNENTQSVGTVTENGVRIEVRI